MEENGAFVEDDLEFMIRFGNQLGIVRRFREEWGGAS